MTRGTVNCVSSVLVKGTTVGTITDFDGNYSLEVPSGKHILVISYMGYKTQDITVGKKQSAEH